MKRMLPVGVFLAAVAFAASNPMLGTWKMNVAKSKFSPRPAPKSVTTTYTEDGDWVVSKTEGVDSEGKPIHMENRVKTDGNEYPYEGPYGKGTISIKQTDPYHWTSVTKVDGGNTITTKSVISKDGKTRTNTVSGTNAKSEKVNTVTVWEHE